MKENIIYLDNAASTPLTSKALNILFETSKNDYANPSSTHKLGKELKLKIDQYKNEILETLQTNQKYDLIFTSSATESNNLLIKSFCRDVTIAYSKSDHPSITKPVLHFKTLELPLNNDSEINLENLQKYKFDVLVISHVNNNSGIIQDIETISKFVKSLNDRIHIHVDAAQSYTKIPISLLNGKIDSLSISSHKIGGPKGIAALILKKDMKIEPLLEGGNQQNGLRSSSESYPLVASFHMALKERFETMNEDLTSIKKLNSKLRSELSQVFVFPFKEENTSPYILTLIAPKISSDILLRHLEQENIFISSSSACSSRIKGEHEAFTALNIPIDSHKNILRISFSPFNNEEEITLFSNRLISIYTKLLKLSR